jgi:hypothetical protein
VEEDGEQLSFTVERGEDAGLVLAPHLYEDGTYVASMTRFKKDYVRVRTLAELYLLAKQGYGIRIGPSSLRRPPSLIPASSLGLR